LKILSLLSVKPFAIIGHRGAAGLARENSLRALEEAIRWGAEIAEFDVQVTRDGVPIASHDETVLFDDGVRASVRALSLAELKTRSVGGEPIPTIEDIVEHARGRIGLFLEVKVPEDTQTVIGLVKRLKAVEWTAIISFHESSVAQATAAGLVTGLVYSKPPGKIVECLRLKCRIVLPRFNLATEKSIAFAHRSGLKVVAWTVNDQKLARELAARGVDGIATDYPDVIASLRKGMGK